MWERFPDGISLLMTRVSDEEADVVVTGEVDGLDDVLGGGDLDGILDVVADEAGEGAVREGVAGLVGEVALHHGRRGGEAGAC